MSVASTKDHAHGVEGMFQVVRCTVCGLHYLNPRPTPEHIGSCYPGDYYAYTAPSRSVPSPTARRRLKRLVRRSRLLSSVARRIPSLRNAAVDHDLADDIEGWIKPGKVLDVGCGAGAFLDGMVDNGWTGFGIEPSSPAAAAAAAKGHAVVCQSVTEPIGERLSQHRFDIILMSHALEHVHSPTRALAHLKPLLHPDSGHLIIEVPNVESLLTYWFGELGLAFDTPRHLYMFSPETLRQLLEKNGFEVRSMRQIARPIQFARCLRLLADIATPEAWRAAAGRSLDDPGLLRALEPLARHASEHGLGGAIRAVAVRK
ncbi:MAG: class I SAM-dependent methyltransferase [Thiobacillus sp.]|nr:class I SAM-dependent methyltransferase [Thiobacillus sp.]